MAESNPKRDVGLIIVTALLLLIIMSFWYVRPYLLTKHFKKSECTVVGYNESIIWDPECECIDDLIVVSIFCAVGNYTCLEIEVSFVDSHSQNRTAFLYQNDQTFAEDWRECSYRVCETYDVDDERYKDDYVKFRNTYATIGATFKCHYDEESNEAVVERIATRAKAIGSTVGSIAGGIVLLLIYGGCYCACK